MTTPRSTRGSTASGTGTRSGFALVDLAIVLAILLTLLTPAIPIYVDALSNAKETLAVRDLVRIQAHIERHRERTGTLPGSLQELEAKPGTDPWGNPFQYTRAEEPRSEGHRLDGFLRPLNAAYDLYSRGPDGRSSSPLTAGVSRDDIVLAGDGRFIGPVRDYPGEGRTVRSRR